MAIKRKDNRGRILKDNEFQRSDGRYVYKYWNVKGELRSIYSWRLTETDSVPAGKRQCESLREMEKRIRRDVEDGLLTQQKVTLNERWDEYIANKPELKQSTRENYQYMYNKYIRDEVGGMLIADIKYSHMKKFFNLLIHKKGFKPNSVEVIHTILNPVFTIAMRDGYVRLNPMSGIMNDLKRSNDWEKPKRHSLTEPQQKRFMEFLENSESHSHWLTLFTCLLGTGCRIGEMLGLRWEDIDWQENIISINHGLIYRKQEDGKCAFRITTPKTKNSVREIPMFRSVRKALLAEREQQMQTGFCQEVIDGYAGFIWQNRFGKVFSPHCVNRAIERIVRDCNIEEHKNAEKEHREPILVPSFSAHQLRHTFCTRLCENERDLKLIQEIMGHADITTTMDIYNESNTERKKASFSRLEQTTSIF